MDNPPLKENQKQECVQGSCKTIAKYIQDPEFSAAVELWYWQKKPCLLGRVPQSLYKAPKQQV